MRIRRYAETLNPCELLYIFVIFNNNSSISIKGRVAIVQNCYNNSYENYCSAMFLVFLQKFTRLVPTRPSAAPGLGVGEWSPEGLHDKSVSLIPNTDEILKLVKKQMK